MTRDTDDSPRHERSHDDGTPDFLDVVASGAGRSSRRRMLILLSPFRTSIALCVVLVCVQVGLSIVPPILLRSVIDTALPHHDERMLAVLCVAMFGAAAVATGLGIAQSVLINGLTQRVVHRLRTAIYTRLRSMSLPFFTATPVSEVETRVISDIGGISSAVSLTAQSAVAASIQVVAALGAMLYLDWLLAVIASGLALLLAVITERSGRRRRELAERIQAETSHLMFVLGEDLTPSGVLASRTFLRFDSRRQRFVASSRRLARLVFRQRLAGTGLRSIVGLTFAAIPPLLYFLAGTSLAGVSVGTVVVLTTLQARLSSPLQQLLGYSSSMATVTAMLDRTFEYIDLQASVSAPARHLRHTDGVQGIAGGLATHGLTYRYPEQDHDAVLDVSVTFDPRSLNVVVGESGSGKSTLGLLLGGQLHADRGEIVCAGESRPPEDLWPLVTVIAQDPSLFDTSLRENLLFAAPHSNDSRLRAALELVGLGDLLRGLPNGLDTGVGGSGAALSGGERQRVALARAVLNRSPFVVLDEPTSALDNQTSARIQSVLQGMARTRTVVLITHRIPPLDATQHVVVMAEGRVVEDGTHADLESAGGVYANLLALQHTDEPLDAAPDTPSSGLASATTGAA